jgi:hypothetical protein
MVGVPANHVTLETSRLEYSDEKPHSQFLDVLVCSPSELQRWMRSEIRVADHVASGRVQ